jgi:hypothetical protein
LQAMRSYLSYRFQWEDLGSIWFRLKSAALTLLDIAQYPSNHEVPTFEGDKGTG